MEIPRFRDVNELKSLLNRKDLLQRSNLDNTSGLHENVLTQDSLPIPQNMFDVISDFMRIQQFGGESEDDDYDLANQWQFMSRRAKRRNRRFLNQQSLGIHWQFGDSRYANQVVEL